MENDRPILGDDGDLRAGAYDPVNELGKPRPHQIRQAMTLHQAAQPGADVRPDPLPSRDDVVPERLRPAPQGPLNPRRGRGN